MLKTKKNRNIHRTIVHNRKKYNKFRKNIKHTQKLQFGGDDDFSVYYITKPGMLGNKIVKATEQIPDKPTSIYYKYLQELPKIKINKKGTYKIIVDYSTIDNKSYYELFEITAIKGIFSTSLKEQFQKSGHNNFISRVCSDKINMQCIIRITIKNPSKQQQQFVTIKTLYFKFMPQVKVC